MVNYKYDRRHPGVKTAGNENADLFATLHNNLQSTHDYMVDASKGYENVRVELETAHERIERILGLLKTVRDPDPEMAREVWALLHAFREPLQREFSTGDVNLKRALKASAAIHNNALRTRLAKALGLR